MCRRYGLYLFVDGARLAYGLMAEGNDVDLPVLAANCDVFYIGGTKVGALFGEAVVILNEGLKPGFPLSYQGAECWQEDALLGIQFSELLKDRLYMELGRHADRLAGKIRRPVRIRDTHSGIQYHQPGIPHHAGPVLKQWEGRFSYTHRKGRVDDSHTAIRLCTSWITSEENVDILVREILNS